RRPVVAPFVVPRSSRRRAVVVVESAEHGERRDRAGKPGLDAFARVRNRLATPGLLRDSLARRPVGGSAVREIRSPGSVRGRPERARPYRNPARALRPVRMLAGAWKLE